ncbi:MAG: response regulator [Candidatus Omnitrophica bacterium]|nr:response regulator [Candidatus Omnitrophota bacterium]
MKILVVDDSLLDRKLLIRILMKSGISQEILQAENGEQAMEILANNYKDICLILLDWQMPKISGIELMAGIVKIPELSNIPIIMVTASGSDENKRTAGHVNPNLAGYLVKPYKPEELLSMIKPFLR